MTTARSIRAGRAYVELGVQDRFSRALRQAEAQLRRMGQTVRQVGVAMTAASAAALAPLAAAVQTFRSVGDELDKVSRRTGLSVEAISELGFAAEQSGAGMATLERSVRGLQRTIFDAGRGTATATDALAALGLSAAQLEGLLPEDQLDIVADRLAAIDDVGRRAAIAMAIFGRGGAQILPLLENGAAGLREMREQAREFGLTVSGDSAKAAARLGDALNLARRSIRAAAMAIGEQLAPAAERMAIIVARAGAAARAWAAENGDLIRSFARVAVIVGGVGVAITTIGIALGGMAATVALGSAAFTAIAGAVGATIVVMKALAVPIAILGGALTASMIGWRQWSDGATAAVRWVGDSFGQLQDTIASDVRRIVNVLMAGEFGAAMDLAVAGMTFAWQTGLSSMLGALDGFRTAVADRFRLIGASIEGEIRQTISFWEAWIRTGSLKEAFWARDRAGRNTQADLNEIGRQIQSRPADPTGRGARREDALREAREALDAARRAAEAAAETGRRIRETPRTRGGDDEPFGAAVGRQLRDAVRATFSGSRGAILGLQSDGGPAQTMVRHLSDISRSVAAIERRTSLSQGITFT